jgi:class 3 adenylate cyclase
MELDELLGVLDNRVKTEFENMPEVLEVSQLDLDRLPRPYARKWVKQEGVVAVMCDLKGSTLLGTGKRDRSTASIYEAATGGAVRVLHERAADFIAIQGDGAFGLFWGELAVERAMCAAITVRTFSQRHLTSRLEERWADSPETGFKVGVAAGRVLVKLVGTLRKPDEQEPVWAGKPVNYAAKCAQQINRHQTLVTGQVWDMIKGNDFLAFTCGCNGGIPGTPSDSLWTEKQVDKIPDDEPAGRLLTAAWCGNHGDAFMGAILAGERNNPDASDLRRAAVGRAAEVALDAVRAQQKDALSARRRGL